MKRSLIDELHRRRKIYRLFFCFLALQFALVLATINREGSTSLIALALFVAALPFGVYGWYRNTRSMAVAEKVQLTGHLWGTVTLNALESEVMASLGRPDAASEVAPGERTCEWRYPDIGKEVFGRCRFSGGGVVEFEIPRFPTQLQLLRG